MFDIGFSELVIISLIALIAIGPKRLPQVARTLGHLAGRLQRYVADVKADINREVEMEELKKMRESVEQAATSFESSVQSEIHKTEADLNAAASAAAGDPPMTSETPKADEAAAATAQPPKLGSERQAT